MSINGKALAYVTSTTYLGVLIDQNLTWNYMLLMFWKDYIQVVCFVSFETIARSSAILIISSFCSTSFWLLLWRCLGTHYGITFKATRTFTLSFLQQVPASNSFIKLTLAERRHFYTAVQAFKLLHYFSPGYLRNWFVYAEAYTGHSGWNKHSSN